jgi:hypothetical protein
MVWSVRRTLDRKLATAALPKAIVGREALASSLYHSDLGECSGILVD